METCTTFGQQPPLPAPMPCVCTSMWETLCPVDKCRNIQQPSATLAKILASACLLKCKIVQLRNCFVPRDCQHSAAVSSSRSFAVFGTQFSARHLRLATLMQFALYSVCFCFCYFAHTPTRGVTRGQSLRQRHLEADLHSSSLNLSCCTVVAF